jgi:spore coat protein U-like protein
MKSTIKSVSLKLALVAAAGAFACLDATPAEAATDTSNLSVTASISANCTITTTAVAFGAYDPVSTNAVSALNGTGKVTVTCTTGSHGYVTLGQGANADTGSEDATPIRQMKDTGAGTNFLSYSLWSNTLRTVIWGNTETTGVDHTGDGTATDITVYGKIPGGQNKPALSYSDTVLATVTF